MAQVTNFFVGANSGEGFRNLFSEMVDIEDTYDFMVLKGGPGVGKVDGQEHQGGDVPRQQGHQHRQHVLGHAAGIHNISLVKRLAVDDKLDFDTAKILIAAYRETQKKMEVEWGGGVVIGAASFHNIKYKP